MANCDNIFEIFGNLVNDSASDDSNAGSEVEDVVLEDEDVDSEDENEEAINQIADFVGRNGRRWLVDEPEQHGRRGRENVIRQRMQPTANPLVLMKPSINL